MQINEQLWRESLKEGDRVVVKKEERPIASYYEGTVVEKNESGLVISSQAIGGTVFDKRYYTNQTFDVKAGFCLSQWNCSIVPPDNEDAKRYFLSEQIKAAIEQGVLNRLPLEILEDLAGVLG